MSLTSFPVVLSNLEARQTDQSAQTFIVLRPPGAAPSALESFIAPTARSVQRSRKSTGSRRIAAENVIIHEIPHSDRLGNSPRWRRRCSAAETLSCAIRNENHESSLIRSAGRRWPRLLETVQKIKIKQWKRPKITPDVMQQVDGGNNLWWLTGICLAEWTITSLQDIHLHILTS